MLYGEKRLWARGREEEEETKNNDSVFYQLEVEDWQHLPLSIVLFYASISLTKVTYRKMRGQGRHRLTQR